MRLQLKALLKEYGRKGLAVKLGTTFGSICMSKHRGYLSKLLAERAETRLGGRYKARLLVKK